MGRFKLKKQRRDRQQTPTGQRFHIDNRAVSQAEILAAGAQMSDNVDDNGWLLCMNSPSLGLGQVATGIDPDTGTLAALARKIAGVLEVPQPATA
ncbi:hypothetical protein ABT033_35960 [Streptomyces pharetrae]|uniref:hypothetical protein n=1 Tax=Streptomyces pharetrae TaxID=291370 RepID=UPI003361DB52